MRGTEGSTEPRRPENASSTPIIYLSNTLRRHVVARMRAGRRSLTEKVNPSENHAQYPVIEISSGTSRRRGTLPPERPFKEVQP